MDQLLTRELINIGLASLFLSIVAVLSIRLFSIIQHDGWYNNEGHQIMLGISALLLGDGLYRAWAGVLLWSDRHGSVLTNFEETYRFAVLFFVIGVVGALCTLRILTRRKNSIWFACFLFMAFMMFLAWEIGR